MLDFKIQSYVLAILRILIYLETLMIKKVIKVKILRETIKITPLESNTT